MIISATNTKQPVIVRYVKSNSHVVYEPPLLVNINGHLSQPSTIVSDPSLVDMYPWEQPCIAHLVALPPSD